MKDGPDKRLDDLVTIVGAGFGGISAFTKLLDRGFDPANIRVLEARSCIGGVWCWNKHPNAGSDSKGFVYLPFLKRMGFVPRRLYSSQEEITDYAANLSAQIGMDDRIVFREEVTKASWDSLDQSWRIESRTGNIYQSKYLIWAIGLGRGVEQPRIKGLSSFKGMSLHASDWHQGIDVSGKTVGVVGTGATSIQVAPGVAGKAKHVYVFQRSAAYVFAKGDTEMPEIVRNRLLHGPELTPFETLEVDGSSLFGLTDGSLPVKERLENAYWRNRTQARFRKTVERTVRDPATRAALIPDYPIFCKRPLFSDHFLELFNRPDVSLVAHRSGIDSIDSDGVNVGGKHYKVDVLVFATGNVYKTEPGIDGDVFGKNNIRLSEHYHEGPKNFAGIVVRNFPNMFFVGGVHGTPYFANVPSMLHLHADWVSSMIRKMEVSGLETVEPTKRLEEDFTDHVRSSYKDTIFSRCKSWYNQDVFFNEQGEPRGRIPVYFTGTQLASMLRMVDYDDFEFSPPSRVSAFLGNFIEF